MKSLFHAFSSATVLVSNATEAVVIVRELKSWMFMVDDLESQSRDHHRRSIFRLLEF